METLLAVLTPVTFIAALVAERIWPGRQLPVVKRWVVKGILFFIVAGALNAVLASSLGSLLGPYAVFDLGGIGAITGGIIALVVFDFFSYWLHRTLHTVPRLWRWTHQLHHSAERVDTAGVAYFHPLDITSQIIIPMVIASLCGMPADALAVYGYLGLALAVFQHVNVRTPVWVGWIIQRPEAHSVHHARGIHAYNYGNVMIWDIVFGTFRNPATFTGPSGFWDGASRKLGAMLVGRDVAEPAA